MTRQVFCRKYKQELEGLDFAPFPGAKVKNSLRRFQNRLGKNG
jgi:Fe-S cluster biosynthesis and repair protein YggX